MKKTYFAVMTSSGKQESTDECPLKMMHVTKRFISRVICWNVCSIRMMTPNPSIRIMTENPWTQFQQNTVETYDNFEAWKMEWTERGWPKYKSPVWRVARTRYFLLSFLRKKNIYLATKVSVHRLLAIF